MADKKCGLPEGDTAVLGPALPGGKRVAFRHTADHKAMVGVVSPVKEGEALRPGAIILEPKEGCEGVYDVTDIEKLKSGGKSGPAQVATKSYREGYDRIFGKQVRGQA